MTKTMAELDAHGTCSTIGNSGAKTGKTVILAEGISKVYKLFAKHSDRLKETFHLRHLETDFRYSRGKRQGFRPPGTGRRV